MCTKNITDLDPDEVAVATLRIIQFLSKKGLFTSGKPEDCIDGEVDCPYCQKTLKYWQSSANGHRGFSCECIGGATYQE